MFDECDITINNQKLVMCIKNVTLHFLSINLHWSIKKGPSKLEGP